MTPDDAAVIGLIAIGMHSHLDHETVNFPTVRALAEQVVADGFVGADAADEMHRRVTERVASLA